MAMMRTVGGALVVLVAAIGHRAWADLPMDVLEDPAAAHAALASGATCIPRSLTRASEEDIQLRLGTVAQRPVLCAIARSADATGTVGTLGCFVVDLDARKLASRGPTLLPGVAIPTRLVDGCTHGLCISDHLADPTADAMIAIDDTEAQLVVIVPDAAYLFDAATRKPTGKVTFSQWGWSGRDLVVAHRLITEEHAAGPTAGAFARSLAPDAENPASVIGDVNVDGGLVSALQPGHVLLATAGGFQIFDWDANTNKTRVLRKKPIPNCFDEDPNLPCPAWVAKKSLRLGSDVIAIPGGYLVADRTRLIEMDQAFRVRRQLSVMCPATPSKTVGRVISPTGVGPITKMTTASAQELTALFGDDWSRDSGHLEGDPRTRYHGAGLVVVDQGGKVGEVRVEDRRYRTLGGSKVGDTVARLNKAYPDLTCLLKVTQADELTCTTPSLGNVTFEIELPSHQPEEGKVAPSKIARQKIRWITWH
jgi:hypothetical protein